MGALDQLYTKDLSFEIAQLPRKPNAVRHPDRLSLDYITFHYSGVLYSERSEGAEIARILSEAAEHLRRNWGDAGDPPVYGSTYMYDVVVLSSGGVVKCQQRAQQLWHAGNALANRTSASVHVLLGPGQDLTAPQRASLFRVFDAIRKDGDIPAKNVVGHCEWPRGDGAPVPSRVYRLLPRQSECPNSLLHAHLVAYRDQNQASDPWAGWGTDFPLDPAARSFGIPQAWIRNPWLGMARGREIPLPNSAVMEFANGWILWDRASGKATAVPRPK